MSARFALASARWVLLWWPLTLMASVTPGQERGAKPLTDHTRPDPTAFSVYVLSRGNGVPARSKEVLKAATDIIEADKRRGVHVETRRIRIGLEGETRLCVDYETASDAERAFEKIAKAAKGVELVNLVRGGCPASQPK